MKKYSKFNIKERVWIWRQIAKGTNPIEAVVTSGNGDYVAEI